MRKGRRGDPLLLQVLPTVAEEEEIAGFSHDPLGERAATVAAGLIQKYAGRALLITTPGCAVHCRYCFRRHFPYDEHRPNELTQALDALRTDSSIHEIILSGGDPLLLSDDRFDELLDSLEAIQHIQRIRIHTRLPIVLPQRITAKLMARLRQASKPIVMVVHSNHANELDEMTERAFALLKQTGITLLNQTVLLAGDQR